MGAVETASAVTLITFLRGPVLRTSHRRVSPLLVPAHSSHLRRNTCNREVRRVGEGRSDAVAREVPTPLVPGGGVFGGSVRAPPGYKGYSHVSRSGAPK
jgi:hypothetical protein